MREMELADGNEAGEGDGTGKSAATELPVGKDRAEINSLEKTLTVKERLQATNMPAFSIDAEGMSAGEINALEEFRMTREHYEKAIATCRRYGIVKHFIARCSTGLGEPLLMFRAPLSDRASEIAFNRRGGVKLEG